MISNTKNNNSDEIYERYKDEDFTDAKPFSDIPALQKLQEKALKQFLLRLPPS